MELMVSFSTSVMGNFRDSIRILGDGDFEYQIPVSAISPKSQIVFENFINLGFIPMGKESSQTIKFKNEGSVDGKVELSYKNLPEIKIEPG